jgi:hypothetical protein
LQAYEIALEVKQQEQEALIRYTSIMGDVGVQGATSMRC